MCDARAISRWKVALTLSLGVLIHARCSILPARPPLVVMRSLPAAASEPLDAVHDEIITARGARASAFLPLVSNREAMLFRLLMIERATTSTDLQYFIGSDDEVAALLFSRLLAASERGGVILREPGHADKILCVEQECTPYPSRLAVP